MNKTEERTITNAYKRYRMSTATSLYDVYKTFSRRKANAFNNCLQIKESMNGFNGRIIGHNCDVFSYGFEYIAPTTGVVCFCYITPTYTRKSEVTPEMMK